MNDQGEWVDDHREVAKIRKKEAAFQIGPLKAPRIDGKSKSMAHCERSNHSSASKRF